MEKKHTKLNRGILISIEGIDGAGKSSLVSNFVTLLNKNHFDTIATKEPGGTPIGKVLRQILQTQEAPLCPIGQYLLFAADRAEHFSSIVIPALQQKKIVISDRMNDSSIAYQGYGNGLSVDMVKSIDRWTMQNHTPDIVFYIKIDLETALDRIKSRGETTTFFEKKEFLKKVLTGFQNTFSNRKNVCVLDGTKSQTELTQNAYTYFEQWISNNSIVYI
jgi:dTMP kinase